MIEKNTEQKKVAILIDGENVSLKYLDKIFARARSEGYICFKRIYGKVKIRPNAENPLLEYGITHIQCYSYVPDKNTADMVLAVDAMVQLYKNDVDVFCIVSSDSDFAPLVNRIIEEGRTVIGMGESKAVKSFRNSCDEFVLLDDGAAKKSADKPKSAQPDAKPAASSDNSDIAEPLSPAEAAASENTEPLSTIPTDGDALTETVADVGDADQSEAASDGAATPETASEPDEASDAETAPLPTLDELKELIISKMKAEDTPDGYHMLSRIFSKLHESFPEFSPKKYGAGTPANLVSMLGFKLEKRYKNGKKSGSYDAYVTLPEDGEVNNDAKSELPSVSELTENVIRIIKANANAEGRVSISAVINKLKNEYPHFSIRKYGLGNATAALNSLGFDAESNYVGLGSHQTPDATEEVTADSNGEQIAQSPETESKQESNDTDATAPATEQDDGEVAANPEENDGASTEEDAASSDIPTYVELPEHIDTKADLKTAIIFILSTESVNSATRLSAPLKRYYPDFKIKNYGHTKMKSLLEELGLFVF